MDQAYMTSTTNNSLNLLPTEETPIIRDPYNNGSYPETNTTITNTTGLLGSIASKFQQLPKEWPLLTSIISHSSSVAVIIGCILPYVPQYFTIYRNQSCYGFSTYICLTQLIANIMRIAFWFGHQFELPLLIQSFVMIIVQLLLMELCVRVKPKSLRASAKKHHFFSLEFRYFWKWTNLTSYLEFLSLFSLILAGTMYLLIRYNQLFVIEAVGLVAAITEAMLGVPQVIKNYRKKSVVGMSLGMVIMWLLGDFFKTAYFVFRGTPRQFWLCGSLQVSIDLVILCQVRIYR